MTTTAQATDAQEERIVRLFAEGHGIDFVCERGYVAGVNGWNRARVLEVVSRRGWTLDGSGRVPRQDRPAVTPGKPVPRTPSGKTQIGAVGGGHPAVVPAPRPSPGRSQLAALLDRHPEQTIGALAAAAGPAVADQLDRAVAEAAATKTPTKEGAVAVRGRAAAPASGAAEEPNDRPRTTAVGTAPDSSEAGHGIAGPDAQPQVSPSRTRSEDGGGRGASDAPATPPAARCSACTAGVHDECLAVDSPYPPSGTEPCDCIEGACGGDPLPEAPILMAPAADTADGLLERAASHADPGIRDHARRATVLLEQIRAALARDDQRAALRARLAELDTERDAILARLAEPLLPDQAPTAHEVAADQAARVRDVLIPAHVVADASGEALELAAGLQQATEALAEQLTEASWPDTTGSCGTWGGFLKHRYRGQTVVEIEQACPPCYAAKATRGRKAAS